MCRNRSHHSLRYPEYPQMKVNKMMHRIKNVDGYESDIDKKRRRNKVSGVLWNLFNQSRELRCQHVISGSVICFISTFSSLLVLSAIHLLYGSGDRALSDWELKHNVPDAPHHPFDVVIGKCHCDLISTDCLSSIKCLPSTNQQILESIAKGVMTRNVMRNYSIFEGMAGGRGLEPMGKSLKHSASEAWKLWTSSRTLHFGYYNSRKSYIDSSRYPFCDEHDLKGMNCFFDEFTRMELAEDWNHWIEDQAMMNWYETHSENEEDDQMEGESLRTEIFEKYNQESSALSHVMTYADLLRIHFQQRPFLRDLYVERLQTIKHHEDIYGQRRLSVSLHIRRADSCYHRQSGFESKASDLDSTAQPTNLRKCYNISVYLDVLKRVQVLSGQKTLDVYIASDNGQSLMEEIKKDHGEIYHEMNWYFLDHGDDVFKYDGIIEFAKNQGELGESAVLDLWLLSHGRLLIGHLGSGFGKVAWLLATARFHTFIPFFSVDGHSFCCDIDEQCAEMKPYISDMDNCFNFRYDVLSRKIAFNKTNYWTEKGHSSRKDHYEQQQSSQMVLDNQ